MQSKLGSFIESLVNVLIGYGVAVVAQKYVFAIVGIHISWNTTFVIGFWMTIISIIRSYLIRRLFNKFITRKLNGIGTQNSCCN